MATGYHLRAKQKAPKPSIPFPRVIFGSGAGLMGRWLRRSNIHDAFLSAAFALHGQVPGGCIRQELEELSLAADWADGPSTFHRYSIRFFLIYQGFCTSFSILCQIIKTCFKLENY